LSEAEDASPSKRLRALRLYCLLEVLYATGLRVSELVALPRSADWLRVCLAWGAAILLSTLSLVRVAV